jgi:hypothetical protein
VDEEAETWDAAGDGDSLGVGADSSATVLAALGRSRTNASLQPCCVPQGIIADMLNEPSPQRIGDEVPRDLPQVLLATQRVIMERALPHRPVRAKTALTALADRPLKRFMTVDSVRGPRRPISQCR